MVPNSDRRDPLAVILLAAGESSRMAGPKQLLPWHGLPLIRYQMDQALAVPGVGEVVVVLGHDADALRSLVEMAHTTSDIRIVVNSQYQEGKSTSIQAGLRAIQSNPQGVLVLAVDQPRPAPLLAALAAAHSRAGALISVPTFQGKHGHPPLFSLRLLPELLAISEEREGLREVLTRHRGEVQAVSVDSPIVLTNLNTEEEYRRARAEFPPPRSPQG